VELTSPQVRAVSAPAATPPVQLWRPALDACLPTLLDHAPLTGKPSRGRANETTGAAGRDRGVGDGLTGPPRVTRWKGEG
jgi:nondiscriminating aspartyl-tRNA synthetase